jgi:hypothetical protein
LAVLHADKHDRLCAWLSDSCARTAVKCNQDAASASEPLPVTVSRPHPAPDSDETTVRVGRSAPLPIPARPPLPSLSPDASHHSHYSHRPTPKASPRLAAAFDPDQSSPALQRCRSGRKSVSTTPAREAAAAAAAPSLLPSLSLDCTSTIL